MAACRPPFCINFFCRLPAFAMALKCCNLLLEVRASAKPCARENADNATHASSGAGFAGSDQYSGAASNWHSDLGRAQPMLALKPSTKAASLAPRCPTMLPAAEGRS